MPSVSAYPVVWRSPTISVPAFGFNTTSSVSDRVLEEGLRILPIEADRILICSSNPTSFGQAVSLSIGLKHFGSGGCFGALATASLGRKVATTSITNGVFTATATATHWAAVDTATSRLLITHSLDAPVAAILDAQFTLPSFEITLTGTAIGDLTADTTALTADTTAYTADNYL